MNQVPLGWVLDMVEESDNIERQTVTNIKDNEVMSSIFSNLGVYFPKMHKVCTDLCDSNCSLDLELSECCVKMKNREECNNLVNLLTYAWNTVENSKKTIYSMF